MFHRARHAHARRRFTAGRRHPGRGVVVTVYLSAAPPPMIGGYRPDGTFVLAGRFLLSAAEHRRDGDDRAVLERIFAALNGHPHHDDAHHTRRWYGRNLRSLSVGDIVAVGDRHYACGALGWLHVPSPS